MNEDDYLHIWNLKIPSDRIVPGIIILLMVWYLFTVFFGFKEIGRFGEKRNYETQYWVELQPEKSGSKSYRVKADIERTMPDYYLRTVYWPDGGSSTFDDCLLDKDEYSANGHVDCLENDGAFFGIKVISKVKN